MTVGPPRANREDPTPPDQASKDHLKRLLRDALGDSEQFAHRVRVAVLLLLIARLLIIRHREILTMGQTHHLLVVGIMSGGIVASHLLLQRIRHAPSAEKWLTAVTLLDSVLVTSILFQAVANPRPEYVGVLRNVDVGFYVLVAAASMLRLSPMASIGSALSCAVGLGFLIACDMTWNPTLISYGLPDIVLIYLLLLGASLVSYGSVVWLRGLIRRSAETAVGQERMRQRFGAYVPDAFTSADAEIALGGRRKQVAILFSDIRGFTKYSEGLDPGQLVSELNDYFDALVPAIEAHGGVVDKYIGDAVMAVFGLPSPDGNEALSAVQAAVAMQESLKAHNAKRQQSGLMPMRMGVGVHFGMVVAGNVGTEKRLQYTILGDAVNVAARLESATKERGASILVSQDAYEAARAADGTGDALPPMQAFPPLKLRGRSSQTLVFGVSA